MRTGLDFYKYYKNRKVDVDGYYGAQCWDLFAQFCKDNGVPVINCTSTNYVKDLWNQRNTNGILKSFTIERNMVCGDWAIFGNCEDTPDSHVAMFLEDIDGVRGKFFGQNQIRETVNLKYEDILGAFRLKEQSFKPTIPNNGKVICASDIEVIVRTEPRVSQDTVSGYTYSKGMVLYYDSLILKNGHWWMSYISGNTSTRRYIHYCYDDGTGCYWNKA